MIGTYTYQRLNYIVMVICITPYLLITLHLLDMGFTELVKERLLDTAVAFLLAYGANHLLFPNWESRQLKPVMTAVIRGNMQYLDKLLAIYSGIPPLAMDYRLARKELFVSHSNLSAAFHRMLSEPKSKQASSRKLYEFVALNQLLSSNISSLAPPADLWHRSANRLTWIQLKRIQSVMQDIGERLDIAPIESSMSEQMNTSGVTTQPDKSVVEQLDFIYKVSIDIRKICHQQDFWDAIQPLS